MISGAVVSPFVGDVQLDSGAGDVEESLAKAGVETADKPARADPEIRNSSDIRTDVDVEEKETSDEALKKLTVWKESATLRFRYCSFLAGMSLLVCGVLDAANEYVFDIGSMELITAGCGMMVCAYLQKWPKIT